MKTRLGVANVDANPAPGAARVLPDKRWPKWTARSLALVLALVVGFAMTSHYRAKIERDPDLLRGNLLSTQAALGAFVLKTDRDHHVFLATLLYVEKDAQVAVQQDLLNYTHAPVRGVGPADNVTCQATTSCLVPAPQGQAVLMDDLANATRKLSVGVVANAEDTSQAVLHFEKATVYITYTRGDASPAPAARENVSAQLASVHDALRRACGEACPARYVNLTIVGEWNWDPLAHMDLTPPPGNVVGPFSWTATAKPGSVPLGVSDVLDPLPPVEVQAPPHPIFVPIPILLFAALAIALSFFVEIFGPLVFRNAQPFLPVPLLTLVLVVFLIVTADHGVSVGPAWGWILGPFLLLVIAILAVYVAFPYFSTLNTASTIWGLVALGFTLVHLGWAVSNVNVLDPMNALSVLYDGSAQGRLAHALGSAGTMMSYFLWWGGVALLAWELFLLALTLVLVRAHRARHGGSFADATRALAGDAALGTTDADEHRSRVPEVRLWAMRLALAQGPWTRFSTRVRARWTAASEPDEPPIHWGEIETRFKQTLKETRSVR